MKIAIIGAGMVGGALGGGWLGAGHEVVFGVRDPDGDKARALPAPAKTPRDAAEQAEVVVLATPWDAAEAALRSSGDLRGKVLLDATNPLRPQLAGLTHGHDSSGAEQVAAWAPGARVVKVFNSTGFNNMADPAYPEGPATMFYCGDDDAARQTAHRLAQDLGFDPVDAGDLQQARLLEPLALLWISLAYRQGLGREIAFRLMRR